MYLYLEREDMRALPKETIRKGNRQAETMVLSAMAVFLVGAASQKTPLMLLGAVFVIGTSIIYFTGAFNPYTRTIKACTKQLNKKPAFEDYKKWAGIETEKKEEE